MSALIQVLLPLVVDGQRVDQVRFEEVRHELTSRFGGLTAFTRAPAAGFWAHAGDTVEDDVVVFEVMTETVDRAWWRDYRARLEARFAQQEVVVRALAIDRL